MFPRLLGDVGGTHARFAWQARQGAGLAHVLSLRGDAHAGLAEAIETYLARQGLPRPQAACIGIANPVTGDLVAMTNRDWSFSIRALADRLGIARLKVINDFTALALSLPDLLPSERVPLEGPVGPGDALPAQPLALLGPGTGLGMGGLVPCGPGRWQALAGEGGHATLAARTALQWRLLERIGRRHGHVSAERVFSGPGLGELHLALSHERGHRLDAPLEAARIVEQAAQDGDCLSQECLALFCNWLGAVAGDLALTLGARGGVYLGGGIAPRLLPFLQRPDFRAGFEDKGRFATYLRQVPVWVITASESPALRGAALALDEEDRQAQTCRPDGLT